MRGGKVDREGRRDGERERERGGGGERESEKSKIFSHRNINNGDDDFDTRSHTREFSGIELGPCGQKKALPFPIEI